MNAVFIAGTDTGIGKTHVAASLIHALRQAGRHPAGMKPVASGCLETPAGLRNEDALALIAAAGGDLPYALVNPASCREPLSPHLAARHAGVTLGLEPLTAAFETLRAGHDSVVVEGIGGWLVPLAPGFFAADLPRAWHLPVILVVGMRLGCLNHAQLSARAIQADGCHLAGWIANRIDPSPPSPERSAAPRSSRAARSGRGARWAKRP